MIKYVILVITFDIFTMFILNKTINYNKRVNKLQKKIYNVKTVKNVKDLIKKLKKGLFILFVAFIISSCCSTNKISIPLQNYTQEEQNQLIKFLKQDNKLINKILIDYYNLRNMVRIGNK